jgi:hypothetical protein
VLRKGYGQSGFVSSRVSEVVICRTALSLCAGRVFPEPFSVWADCRSVWPVEVFFHPRGLLHCPILLQPWRVARSHAMVSCGSYNLFIPFFLLRKRVARLIHKSPEFHHMVPEYLAGP